MEAPKTRRGNNAGLMLGQRRRRWPNIKPALDQYSVFLALKLSVDLGSAVPEGSTSDPESQRN